MPTNKRWNYKKKPSSDKWTEDETKKALKGYGKKALIKAKKQEEQKVYKKVPILHGFKLVEIKPDK